MRERIKERLDGKWQDPGVGEYLAILVIGVIIVMLSGAKIGEAHQHKYCGKDFNGDGYFDTRGEFEPCIPANKCDPLYNDPAWVCGQKTCYYQNPCIVGTAPDGEKVWECSKSHIQYGQYPFDDRRDYNRCMENCRKFVACLKYDKCPLGAGATACIENIDSNWNFKPLITKKWKTNAPVTAEGKCSAEVQVHPGYRGMCAMSGWMSEYDDCCGDSASVMAAGWCDKEHPEWDLGPVKRREQGMAIYLGTWCELSFKGIGCVQRAQGYCIFKDETGIAAYLHRKKRQEYKTFDPLWGSPRKGNCRGFTANELQQMVFTEEEYEHLRQLAGLASKEEVHEAIKNLDLSAEFETVIDDALNQSGVQP